MSVPTQTLSPPCISTKRRSRRRRLLAGLAALVAVGTAWRVDRHYLPRLARGPLVQLSGPNRLHLVWSAASDAGAIRGGELRWADASDPRAVRGNSAGYRDPYLAARLETDQAPASFWYELRSDGWLGRSRVVARREGVRAAPRPGEPFRFLAFGDSGNGSNTQRNLAERMIAARPQLVIHTGDLVYPAGDAGDYERNFFEPYAGLIDHLPFMPSLGNHDVTTDRGQPYLDVFVLPENGPAGIEPERNYWFDFGDARFVALDTNRAADGGAVAESDMRAQVAPWLEEVLCSAPGRWKFVYFHHPPYTGSTHAAADQAFVKEIFVPVFDECGVDMVFCGHNHLYERTKPLRGDCIVPPGQGTVYIVTGAGGVSRYAEVLPNPDYIEVYDSSVFSFTQVDLWPDRLELRQIGDDGNVIDSWTILKSTAPPPITR